MTSSTYPGPYRATTAWRPPGPHTRVTTAHDLGRALYRLHAGAHGSSRALRLLGLSRRQAIVALRVLASAQPVGDNAGLLRPWLAGATVAEKNGWLSDTRTTAAIVYRAAARRSSSSSSTARASLTVRRPSWDVVSCRPRVC